MRLDRARVVPFALLLLATPACDAIFGIRDGEPTSGSGGEGGHGGTGTGATGGTTSRTTSTTSDTGGVDAGTGGTETGMDGGATCSMKGTATCSGSMLTVCDATGHTQPPVDCGAASLCDATGLVCNDFGRLSAGSLRACAIDDGHAVHCWGDNGGSPGSPGTIQLGDIHGMFATAVTVAGVSAYQIAVADTHQCALQANGDVACWGEDGYGQLGLAPTDVPGMNTQVPLSNPAVEIGVASGCSCARLNDGNVWCWGLVSQGCHGDGASDGDQTPGPTPSQVSLGNEAVQIRVGDGVDTPSCARLTGGLVRCWGSGYTPVTVPTVADATNIAVGPSIVFMQRPSGLYWSTPVPPVPPATTWTYATPTLVTGIGTIAMMAAGNQLCTAATGPTVTCTPLWNDQPPVTQLPPSATVSAPGTVVEITSGYGAFYDSTLQCLRISGVAFDQSVYCWGDDAAGNLGVGGAEYFTTAEPVSLSPSTSTVARLTCGESSTSVALADGTAHYWGTGSAYLGNGAGSDTPSGILSALGTSNALLRTEDTLGTGYALQQGGAAPLLLLSGSVSTAPQRLLGYATTSFVDAVPTFVDGLVDMGLLLGGQVVVYSDPPGALSGNDCGIFGDGTTTSPSTSVLKTVPLPAAATAIAAHGEDYESCPAHACAILSTGALYCWGSNFDGESAYDSTPLGVAPTPGQVTIPGVSKLVSVATGGRFACATDGAAGTGQVYCWGRNDYGQLGRGAAAYGASTPVPKAVSGINNGGATVPALGVVAGEVHACAWLADGSVACWGCNDAGQIGNASYDDQPAPVAVKGLTKTVEGLAAGDAHTCALYTDATVACWGSSQYGQVGTGKNSQYPTPTLVPNL